jgi:hypothetical protein
MKTVTLLNATAGTTPNTAYGILDVNDTSTFVIWQLILSSTGSINLEGSTDGTNWALLPLPTGAASTAATTSGLYVTFKAPYVRANPTANGGTITAKIAI